MRKTIRYSDQDEQREIGLKSRLIEGEPISVSDILSKKQQQLIVSIYCNDQDGDEIEILDGILREQEFEEVELAEDIYCIGFLVFLTSDSPKQMSNVVLKCIFCLLIQVMIVLMMMTEYLNVDDSGEGALFAGFLKGNIMDGLVVGNPSINLARVVCCFLLHLELLPELSSAKSMIDFARKNPSAFHN